MPNSQYWVTISSVLCFKLSEKGRRIPCVLDDINFFTESFLCSTGLGYLPPLSSSLFKEPLLVCFIDVSVSWKGSQDIDLPSHANFKSWFVKGFVTDSGKWHSLHSDMAFRKNCSPLIFGVRLQIALNHYDPKCYWSDWIFPLLKSIYTTFARDTLMTFVVK